jgi:hypothetical protein
MLLHRSSVLDDIVDLDTYPIHQLDNPLRAELVAETRAQMDRYGCFRISDFVRPEAIAEMLAEAQSLHEQTSWSQMDHNPYASPDDPSFPPGHPRRFFQRRASGFINSDLLAATSPLNRIYDADVMTHFVWDCLGVDRPIYRWADPLGCNPYGVMEPDHQFPWHFDGNEFTVSILVQRAEQGGIFEYVPDIRGPGDERYERVQAVLDGSREGVRELDLQPGDLQLFKGRFSMHRVTPIVGATTRYIALPTYVFDPYRMNRPHHSINYYGRATELHHERAEVRGDGLVD